MTTFKNYLESLRPEPDIGTRTGVGMHQRYTQKEFDALAPGLKKGYEWEKVLSRDGKERWIPVDDTEGIYRPTSRQRKSSDSFMGTTLPLWGSSRPK